MEDADVRARLIERREELVELSAAAAEARKAVELDQTKVGRLSRMDAMQQQAMDQAVEARRRRDIQRIDAALKRLEEGEYGYCLTCGVEIDAERLAFDPAATRCTSCAQ